MGATGALAGSGQATRPWPRGWRSERTWLALAFAAALVIGQLPLLLAACCGPAATSGVGTAWAAADFAQYESAMQQGASQPGWLILDKFTAEPHAPAFM